MEKCTVCNENTLRYTVTIAESGEAVIKCQRCGRPSQAYTPFKKYWDTNIAETPVFVESDTQRERLMKDNNLRVRPREHIDDLNHRRWTKGLPPLEK